MEPIEQSHEEVQEQGNENDDTVSHDGSIELEPYQPYPLPEYPDVDTVTLETLDVVALQDKQNQLEHALDKIEKLDQVLKRRDQQVKDLISKTEDKQKAQMSATVSSANLGTTMTTSTVELAAESKEPGSSSKDFIKRNVELGPNARYYSSLTEEEKSRVDDILQDAQVPEENTQATENLSSGFIPIPEELSRLRKIDESLRSMIPSQLWEEKSIIFTNDADFDKASTTIAPSSAIWSRRESFAAGGANGGAKTSIKDLDSVMNDNPLKSMKHFEMDRQKLTEIDEKIKQLNGSENNIVINQTQIDALIFEAMKSQADRKGVVIEVM